MKLPQEFMEVRKSSDLRNKMEIKDGYKWNGEWRIILKNHEPRITTIFSELANNGSDNSATVILDFVNNRKANEPNKKSDVEYWFVNINPTKSELKSQTREANINWISRNNLFDKSGTTGKDIHWELKKVDGKPRLELKDAKNLSSQTKTVLDVEILLDFFPVIQTDIYQKVDPKIPPKEPWLTTRKKIVIALIVIVIISLVIYFRKTIWSWIKGENKRKKNTEIDIF